MDRFLSNTINRVDKKGRVSIPAPFRSVLGEQSLLHTVLSVHHPVADAGGAQFVDMLKERLEQMDPLSEAYDVFSLVLEGDGDALRIDPEGRIQLTDNIREHTGIDGEVAFVGRGKFFQMWEPQRFRSFREEAREKVRQTRQPMLSPVQAQANPSPGGPAGPAGEQGR